MEEKEKNEEKKIYYMLKREWDLKEALHLPFYYSLLQVNWWSKIHFWYNFMDNREWCVAEK